MSIKCYIKDVESISYLLSLSETYKPPTFTLQKYNLMVQLFCNEA